MATISAFRKRITSYSHLAIDATVFIYQFEQHPTFEPYCATLFNRLSEGALRLSAASIIVSEILVMPFKQKQTESIRQYMEVFLQLPHFTLVDVDYDVAVTAAQLRAEYRILLADAIHLSAAIRSGAEAFVTNDKALKQVRDIPVILLQDFV